MSRDWLLYLDDLIDSAQKIERFLRKGSQDDFRERFDRGGGNPESAA